MIFARNSPFTCWAVSLIAVADMAVAVIFQHNNGLRALRHGQQAVVAAASSDKKGRVLRYQRRSQHQQPSNPRFWRLEAESVLTSRSRSRGWALLTWGRYGEATAAMSCSAGMRSCRIIVHANRPPAKYSERSNKVRVGLCNHPFRGGHHEENVYPEHRWHSITWKRDPGCSTRARPSWRAWWWRRGDARPQWGGNARARGWWRWNPHGSERRGSQRISRPSRV